MARVDWDRARLPRPVAVKVHRVSISDDPASGAEAASEDLLPQSARAVGVLEPVDHSVRLTAGVPTSAACDYLYIIGFIYRSHVLTPRSGRQVRKSGT